MAKNKPNTDDQKPRGDEQDSAATPAQPPVQPAGTDARVADLEQQLLRIRADFENHKRRSQEEQYRIATVAQTDIVLQLLPVVDNLERAFKDVPADVEKSNWYQGVLAIKKQFEGLLQQLGIERIEAIGKPFNPEIHEAISHEPSDKYEESVISEEFEAGYKLDDQIVRHSKVNVSSGKAKS